jgi:hypothetical protein
MSEVNVGRPIMAAVAFQAALVPNDVLSASSLKFTHVSSLRMHCPVANQYGHEIILR